MKPKPDFCKDCPINCLTEGYVPFQAGTGNDLFVGEAAGEEEAASGKAFVGGAGSWLNSMLKAARIGRPTIGIVNTIGCRPPGNIYPSDPKWESGVKAHFTKEVANTEKALVKYEKKHGRDENYRRLEEKCNRLREVFELAKSTTNRDGREAVAYCIDKHLRPVLARYGDGNRISRIVALGDKALQATTGRKGILLWRGSPLPLKGYESQGPRVIPTLHPAYLMRNAGLFSVAITDLRRRPIVPSESYNLYPSISEVKQFNSDVISFDFEWDHDGNISICGLCDKFNSAMVVPWCNGYIQELQRIFENAKVLIGHNIIGADTKYFEKLGWKITAEIWDTMLMQHLVQPDMRHGLAFVASVFSNKVFWKGSGEEEEDEDGNYIPTGPQYKTWNSPEAIPKEFGGYGGCISEDEAFRLYNARDTDGAFQCVFPLRSLMKRYDIEDVYRYVSVPAAYICRDIAAKGLKIDTSKVQSIREELEKEIVELDATLPEGLRGYEVDVMKQIPAPPGMYKEVIKKCKGGKNFGGSHDPVEHRFDSPGDWTCSVCGKVTPSGKMKELKKIKVPGKEHVTPWNSSQQVIRYAEAKGCKVITHAKTGSVTANKTARTIWGREHTEFVVVNRLKKLVTQANSFAKPGLLKVDRVYFNLLVHGTSEGRLSSSGQRRGIDPNIQNQPKALRKIFVPDYPDWGFLCADIVQGENMLTAWLAKDWERWERLHSPGFDEHSYMASQFFNVPYENVIKGGIQEALRHSGKIINHGRNYGLGVIKTQQYLEEEGYQFSQSDIKEMMEIWKRINARTAQWQQETIETAQKQGYLMNPFGRKRWFQGRDFATKALAFLPASTLADMVLRMMIGLYPDRFGMEIQKLNLQVIGPLPKPWELRIQVHDELTCQGPTDTYPLAARVLSSVMTQPWVELDNFKFDVELKFSPSSWGEAKVIEV